jgi:hypothetical protein
MAPVITTGTSGAVAAARTRRSSPFWAIVTPPIAAQVESTNRSRAGPPGCGRNHPVSTGGGTTAMARGRARVAISRRAASENAQISAACSSAQRDAARRQPPRASPKPISGQAATSMPPAITRDGTPARRQAATVAAP